MKIISIDQRCPFSEICRSEHGFIADFFPCPPAWRKKRRPPDHGSGIRRAHAAKHPYPLRHAASPAGIGMPGSFMTQLFVQYCTNIFSPSMPCQSRFVLASGDALTLHPDFSPSPCTSAGRFPSLYRCRVSPGRHQVFGMALSGSHACPLSSQGFSLLIVPNPFRLPAITDGMSMTDQILFQHSMISGSAWLDAYSGMSPILQLPRYVAEVPRTYAMRSHTQRSSKNAVCPSQKTLASPPRCSSPLRTTWRR